MELTAPPLRRHNNSREVPQNRNTINFSGSPLFPGSGRPPGSAVVSGCSRAPCCARAASCPARRPAGGLRKRQTRRRVRIGSLNKWDRRATSLFARLLRASRRRSVAQRQHQSTLTSFSNCPRCVWVLFLDCDGRQTRQGTIIETWKGDGNQLSTLKFCRYDNSLIDIVT